MFVLLCPYRAPLFRYAITESNGDIHATVSNHSSVKCYIIPTVLGLPFSGEPDWGA